MLKKKIVLVGMFVGFMLVTNQMSIMPFHWGNAYYGVLIATFIFLFLEKTGKINAPMFLLYIVGGLSIAVNDVPTFFKAWQRLGLFIMLTCLISPAFMTDKAIQFKTQMFATTSLMIMISTIISFGLFLTGGGYNPNINDIYFRGATSHSMLMGPVASISCLFCLFQLQYPLKKKMKYFYYIVFAGGIICVMKAGSRTALIACITSLLAFMYFRYREQFMVVVKKYIVYISLVVISAPIWMVYMDTINHKNHGGSTLDTSSRDVLWEQRIREWESNPFLGIGFSAVDANAEEGSTFDRKTGVVETGSSWLCILSMTGVLGFACVVIIFLGGLKKGLKIAKTSPPIGCFLLSYLVFFTIHMLAEGYIFAGGSFLSAQVWLVLGTIYSIAYMPEYGPILEEKLKLDINFRIPTFLE